MVVPILTDAELAELSAEFQIARPKVCKVYRRGSGRDAANAPVAALALVATYDEASGGCRVESVDRLSNESVFAGRLTPDANYVVTFPRGADVRGEDEIEVVGFGGGRLKVVGSPPIFETFAAELAVAAKDVD